MTLNVLLILTLSITLVPGQYWQRQMSLLAGNDFSLGRRTSYLYVARDAFLQKPLLGWGTGVFMHVYENSEQAKAFTRKGYTNRRKAHNTYLEFLIGSGIIGFALFMALIIVAWKNFRRAITNFRQAGDPVSAIQTATFRTAFISLLLFLVLFSDMYHKYLLLSLGVSCGALRLSGEALKGSS